MAANSTGLKAERASNDAENMGEMRTLKELLFFLIGSLLNTINSINFDNCSILMTILRPLLMATSKEDLQIDNARHFAERRQKKILVFLIWRRKEKNR